MDSQPSNSNQFTSKIPDRRLERAVEHVSQFWFPVNPQLLTGVRSGLTSGAYDLNLDTLIDEIRDDFALFTFTLNELSRLMRQEKLPVKTHASPAAALREAGIGRLKKILLSNSSALTTHDLFTSNESQLRQLRGALVSAHTAETVAEKRNIDPEVGFTTALLRQLGLTLIAWNYPTVFRRCLAANNSSLDEGLSKALGFSPALLALNIVKFWGLLPEYNYALGDHSVTGGLDPVEAAKITRSGEALTKLCSIGEALARANDPDHYPSAVEDWNFAKEEIETSLGADGFKTIQDRIKAGCQTYLQCLPGPFSELNAFDPERRVHAHAETALIEVNIFTRGCPPLIKKKFRELYARIRPGKIDRNNIQMVIKDIIPAAGFAGGAIYIVDPTALTLIPRVKISQVALRPLATLGCGTSIPSNDPILAAFRCQSPITENTEGPLAFIAGGLGIQQRVGVLYLEVLRDHLDNQDLNALACFKAIRQALGDVMGIN